MCMKLPIGEWEDLDINQKTLNEWSDFFRDIEDKLNKRLTRDEVCDDV